MLPDDDKRYAIEARRSSESVLKKLFKINDIQLVHLLVVWWLVNLQDARCNNKDLSCVFDIALWQIVLNDCFEYTSVKNQSSDSNHSLRDMWNWQKCCSNQEWFFKTISSMNLLKLSNVKVWFLIHFCETKRKFGLVLICGCCMPCENCWNLLGRKQAKVLNGRCPSVQNFLIKMISVHIRILY